VKPAEKNPAEIPARVRLYEAGKPEHRRESVSFRSLGGKYL
jgi:hypothetical protein